MLSNLFYCPLQLQYVTPLFSSDGSHGFGFLWNKQRQSAACTQLVGRQDFQIVSTNIKQDFFALCYTHSYHRRAIKVFQGNIHYPPSSNTSHLPFMFVLHLSNPLWSHVVVKDSICMVYFNGRAILGTIQTWRSFSLQFIRSLSFCVVRKRDCISWPIVSGESPDKQVGALMWGPLGEGRKTGLVRPDWRRGGTGRLFGYSLISHSCIAQPPQCSVSPSSIQKDPSGMLMAVMYSKGLSYPQGLCCLSPSCLSSPVKLQGRFRRGLLQRETFNFFVMLILKNVLPGFVSFKPGSFIRLGYLRRNNLLLFIRWKRYSGFLYDLSNLRF